MKLDSGIFIFSIVLAFFACPLATTDEQKKTGSDLRRNFYVEDNGEKLLTTVLNGYDNIVQCYTDDDRQVISKMLKKIPKEKQHVLDLATINNLIHRCVDGKWNDTLRDINSGSPFQSIKRGIFPGTKWCGNGNISSGYDDLGPQFETDICCRVHDYCDDNIDGFGTKHGLRNPIPFTRSNCRCDDDFYNCLQDANTRTSNGVGDLYFNILETSCFKLEHPIINCTRYAGTTKTFRTCQEYVLDKDKEPKWQFFDAKEYKPLSSNKSN